MDGVRERIGGDELDLPLAGRQPISKDSPVKICIVSPALLPKLPRQKVTRKQT
jgi:hypothetical protein